MKRFRGKYKFILILIFFICTQSSHNQLYKKKDYSSSSITNLQSLKVLKRSNAKKWNSWREAYWLIPDLSNLTIDKKVLGKSRLDKYNFTEINFNNSKLTGLLIDRSNFLAATFKNANIDAHFRGCNFRHTDFRGAKIRIGSSGTEFQHAKFDNAIITRIYFEGGVNVSGVDFSVVKSMPKNMFFESNSMEYANFSGLNLYGAQFNGCIANGAKFIKTNLTKAEFSKGLHGVYNSNTKTTTHYYGSSLRKTNFRKAILKDSLFIYADLRGANFIGANLNGAKFKGANMKGAKVDRKWYKYFKKQKVENFDKIRWQ